jgi:hypothetical protein
VFTAFWVPLFWTLEFDELEEGRFIWTDCWLLQPTASISSDASKIIKTIFAVFIQAGVNVDAYKYFSIVSSRGFYSLLLMGSVHARACIFFKLVQTDKYL